MTIKNVILATIATISFSALAAGGVATAPRVKPGVAVSPKAKAMENLFMKKSAVAQEEAKVQGRESCDIGALASRAGGKVSATRIKAAIDAKVLKSGNCSADGIWGIKKAEALENLVQTTDCMLKNNAPVLAPDQLSQVRGQCLFDAKQDDKTPAQTTLEQEKANGEELATNCKYIM